MEYILHGNNNSVIISDIRFFEEDEEFPSNTLCLLKVHSNNFSGVVEFDLNIKCLAEFSRNLKSMYDTLTGHAVLKETYEPSYIDISSAGNGHFTVSGSLNLVFPRHLLEFEFDIDQTMLRDFAYSLYNDFSKH